MKSVSMFPFKCRENEATKMAMSFLIFARKEESEIEGSTSHLYGTTKAGVTTQQDPWFLYYS